jgi:hypothetical protein
LVYSLEYGSHLSYCDELDNRRRHVVDLHLGCLLGLDVAGEVDAPVGDGVTASRQIRRELLAVRLRGAAVDLVVGRSDAGLGVVGVERDRDTAGDEPAAGGRDRVDHRRRRRNAVDLQRDAVADPGFDVAGDILAPVGDGVGALGGEVERAGVGLRGATVDAVVGGSDAGESIVASERDLDGVGVPTAGRRVRNDGRRGGRGCCT